MTLWLLTWFVLARMWSHRTTSLVKVNVAAFVFLLIAILLAFPPFADLLLRK